MTVLNHDDHPVDQTEMDGTAAVMGNATTLPERFYPIGTPGIPWTEKEQDEWRASVRWQRSYQTEVVDVLLTDPDISELFDVETYGELSVAPAGRRYPLYVAKSKTAWGGNTDNDEGGRRYNLSLLVTGGVHGYETSGVQGALLFLQSPQVREYVTQHGVDILVAPCISPWSYEHVQRWNASLLDPNRSFKVEGDYQTDESRALMEYVAKIMGDNGGGSAGDGRPFTVHLDLHETTDTDATEFMPAKHAAAGLPYEGETIPDGFYFVGDSENPQLDFLQAVIDAVRTVTHIAPPDDDGNIIDFPVAGDGVIIVPATELGLCCSLSKGATYVTTTEVYPDSPHVTAEQCNRAQVAAITGAMDYVLSKYTSKPTTKGG